MERCEKTCTKKKPAWDASPSSKPAWDSTPASKPKKKILTPAKSSAPKQNIPPSGFDANPSKKLKARTGHSTANPSLKQDAGSQDAEVPPHTQDDVKESGWIVNGR